MIIRDHDWDKFEARKAFVARLVDYLNAVHGEGTFTLSMRDSYYNMKEKILPHMELIHRAEAAMTEAVGYAPAARHRIGAAITINAGPHTVGVAFRAK